MNAKNVHDFSIEGNNAHYGDDLVEKPGFFSRVGSFFGSLFESKPVDDQVIIEGQDKPYDMKNLATAPERPGFFARLFNRESKEETQTQQEEKPGLLSRMFNWTKEKVSGGYDYVADNVKAGYNWTKGKVKAGYDYVTDNAKAGYDYVADNAKAGYNWTKGKVKAGYNYVAGNVKDGANYVADNAVAGYDWASKNAKAGADYVSDSYGKAKDAVHDSVQETFVGRAMGIDSVSQTAESQNNAVAKKREDYSGFRGTMVGNWLCNSALGRFFGADDKSFEERRTAYSAAQKAGLEASSYIKNNAIGRMMGIDDVHQNYAKGQQYNGTGYTPAPQSASMGASNRLAMNAQKYQDQQTGQNSRGQGR